LTGLLNEHLYSNLNLQHLLFLRFLSVSRIRTNLAPARVLKSSKQSWFKNKSRRQNRVTIIHKKTKFKFSTFSLVLNKKIRLKKCRTRVTLRKSGTQCLKDSPTSRQSQVMIIYSCPWPMPLTTTRRYRLLTTSFCIYRQDK
jgi:hypothetical protein